MQIIFLIAFLILIFNIGKAVIAKKQNDKNVALRPKLAQEALDVHCKVEKAFIKNYMPFIDYAKGLELYYKKGGRKLTETELNYYFSYPKHIYLDENKNVICNGVDIGKLDGHGKNPNGKGVMVGDKIECPLFKFKGWCPYDCYNNKTMVFTELCGGDIIINECKFSHDYTSGYSILNEECEGDKLNKLTLASNKIFENIINGIKDYEKKYNENKDLLDKYLPEELKEIYTDINNHNYTKDEIDRKLVDFYARANIAHLKDLKEKGLTEEKSVYIREVNDYESCSWGNAATRLCKEAYMSGEHKGFMKTRNSGYLFTKDIMKYEDNFGDKIKEKYNLKINY